MFELLCFDICAFAILGTLCFAIRGKQLMAGFVGRILAVLIYVSVIAVAFDLLVTVYNQRGYENSALGYILSAVYNIMRVGSFYLYSSYIVALMGTWYKTGSSLVRSIRFVPCFAVGAISISAPFSHLFYYYSDGACYRGPAYFAIYLCSGIYMVFSIYYIIKNTRIVGKVKTTALALCSMFSFVASFIQYTKPFLIVDMIGFTLSLVVIVLIIDNPDDKVDVVTGLMNVSSYYEELTLNFYTGKKFDIIHVDMTNIQFLDEVLNFETYAAVLKTLADKLNELNARSRMYGSMYYTRNGGFRIIHDTNDFDRTWEFATAVCNLFNGEISQNDMVINIEAGIWITQCPNDFNSLESILGFKSTADTYVKTGEIMLSKEIIENDRYNIRNTLGNVIERGIINNSYYVMYQPLFNVHTREFDMAESIPHLFDEEKGVIGADVIRPIAEENGSINKIAAIVFESVCRFTASDEFKKSSIKKIGISLSAVQCLQKNLAEAIIAITEKTGANPENIYFEITQTIASDNQKSFSDAVMKLSDYGFTFCYDNYGSGYSNIINLSRMPIDTIRLDREFSDVSGNKKLEVIFEKSIEMIRSLKRKVIVSGVDSAEAAARFTEYRCDYLQGEYYSGVVDDKELLRLTDGL